MNLTFSILQMWRRDRKVQLLGRQWLIRTSEGHQHAVVPRGSTGENPVFNTPYKSLWQRLILKTDMGEEQASCNDVHATWESVRGFGWTIVSSCLYVI